ncbi:MAG: hypothetical protein IJ874_09880 [Ruminococcus sp.]|nr:hypothetical protein [Ruminococcus sp.]
MKKKFLAKAAALALTFTAVSVPVASSPQVLRAAAVTLSESRAKELGISVSGKIVPTGTIAQGRTYIIAGNISSRYTIAQVFGGVYNADTMAKVLYCEDTPNSNTYDLRAKFDNELTFNTLPEGRYIYRITVRTVQDDVVVAESNFTVGGGKSTPSAGTLNINVSDKIVPAGNLEQGKPYIIGGFLNSNYAITQVYGGVYSADGKTSVLYCEDAPNTTTYNLKTKFDNMLTFNKLAAGSYIYRITAKTAQGEKAVAESTFTVGGGKSTPSAGTLNINVSDKIVPMGNLEQGKPYIIGGFLNSNYAITQVYGGVYSADGKTSVLYCEDTPIMTTYNLKTKFDNMLTFNKLTAGSYIYRITAKTAQGEKAVAESTFTVGKSNTNGQTAPVVTVSGKKTPTGTIALGNYYIIGGVINSNTAISQVFGGVYSADGTTKVLYCEDSPNSATYDLSKKFDNELTFNKLTAGKYIYRITVKTAQNEIVVAESEFTVGSSN